MINLLYFFSDLLAVPDFLAGAMEDWGLVSFRSSYLMYEENLVTVDQKKMVTLVIAHELAHQVSLFSCSLKNSMQS